MSQQVLGVCSISPIGTLPGTKMRPFDNLINSTVYYWSPQLDRPAGQQEHTSRATQTTTVTCRASSAAAPRQESAPAAATVSSVSAAASPSPPSDSCCAQTVGRDIAACRRPSHRRASGALTWAFCRMTTRVRTWLTDPRSGRGVGGGPARTRVWRLCARRRVRRRARSASPRPLALVWMD